MHLPYSIVVLEPPRTCGLRLFPGLLRSSFAHVGVFCLQATKPAEADAPNMRTIDCKATDAPNPAA